MARPTDAGHAETIAYHGEVWTDGRGYATVRLPSGAGPLEPPLEYELRDIEPPTTARITAELHDGRFTLATARPHVKVGWRLRGRRRRASHDSDPQGGGTA